MIHEPFERSMTALGGRRRTIRVRTPELVPGRRYPVLYMHDGQNLFRDQEATFGRCWRLDETLDELGLELIVVGVDSNPVGHGRIDELCPWTNDWVQTRTSTIDRSVGGESEGYFDFLVNELKPWVDASFPTQPGRETTFLAGSSLGGLASLWGACRHREVFSRAACLSSAFWFAMTSLGEYLSHASLPDKMYLDIGTAEGSRQHNEEERLSYINDSRSVYELLQGRGLTETNLRLVVDEGGQHNEAAWARRLPSALRWWLSDFLPPTNG